MKLKVDENGNAVITDGKPVYVHDDGKEIAFDAPGTVATIGRLNAEAKEHRLAKEALETKFSKIPADFDFEKATQALTTVKNLADKQIVDAGEVDKLKADAVKVALDNYESTKYKPLKTKFDEQEQRMRSLIMGHAFASSKFITEKMSIPAAMVQSHFGHLLKVDGDKLIGYDATGNQVFSRAQPGHPASFDEWIETVVDQFPYKDSVLKGSGATGTGAKGSAAGGGGSKTMTRAQFDAMSQNERSAKFKEGYKVVD